MLTTALWRRVLTAGLVLHLAFVTLRVPYAVIGKRVAEVEDYRQRGGVRYHLDTDWLQGAESVQWVIDNVPEDAVVLYDGKLKDALEFVPPLIFPRLLVGVGGVAPDAETFAGRPIARGTIGAVGSGRIVLVGRGDDVGLELR